MPTTPRPSPAGDTAAPAIDADIASALDGAVEPVALSPAARARIKQRLLRRIAAEATPRHVSCETAEGTWQPFGAGVQIKVLHEADGVMSYLLRLAAGASLPPHRHPVDEECVVLEGEIAIGALRFRAGSFHLGRKDVLHDRLVSEHGAVIFLRGATPELAHLI